jgi:hypothetical protein
VAEPLLTARLALRLEARFLETVIIKAELCGAPIYAMLRREWEQGSSPSGGSPREAGEGG